MTPNFVVVVSVLLPTCPICCHIGWGMPYLCSCVEEVVTLLGALLIDGCENLSVVGNDQVKVAAKNINANFVACEL